MKLPKDFIEKYETLLGAEEATAFLKSFEKPAVAGFRVNPLKASQPHFEAAIPDMPWSHYGKVSGKSVAHATGVVYSQEPAAQMVAQVAQVRPGMRVLDLAAAPGGKSTHLLAHLANQGVLVSNEISRKRSKILVENIERFGARNVVVTNESAAKLAKVFPAYFDLIVLDAPCSGEGMFRKDSDAIQYWSADYPVQCAGLQQEILADALKMLAPGGRLVYSTCTWAPEENEDMVTWLLVNYPELRLLDIPKINGMQPGLAMPEVARMYPHHFQGEGQFVAHLQDQRQPAVAQFKAARPNLSREQAKLWETFAKAHLKYMLPGVLQVFGDYLYLLPEGLPDLSKLRIARNGLQLGVFKKNRFEPALALGMALRPDEVKQVIHLTEADFVKYVAGEAIQLPESHPTGWYQVVVAGNGLGFAKVVGTTLKNAYPKGLRFHVK